MVTNALWGIQYTICMGVAYFRESGALCVSKCAGTRVSKCAGTCVSKCAGTRVGKCAGTRVGKCAGTRVSTCAGTLARIIIRITVVFSFCKQIDKQNDRLIIIPYDRA